MELIYQHEVNYLAEAADMIMRSRGQSATLKMDVRAAFEKRTARLNLDPSARAKMHAELVKPIQEVIRHGMEGVASLPEDALAEYFTPVFSCGFSISAMLCEALDFLQRAQCGYAELDAIQRRVLALSLLDFVSNYSEVDFDTMSVTEAADRALADDREKWRFIQTVDGLETHLTRFQALMVPVTARLREKAECLQALYDRCLAGSKAVIGQDGVIHLNEDRQVTLKKGPQIVLEPRVVRYGELTFYTAGQYQILQVGVALELLGSGEQRLDQDALAEACRAMGDKRRMAILMLLKERAYYGQELADRLNLTPATISHHMDVLMSNRLISVSHDGTKVLYVLSKPRIEAVLSGIGQLIDG